MNFRKKNLTFLLIAYNKDGLLINKLSFWVCITRRVTKRDALVLATLRIQQLIYYSTMLLTMLVCTNENLPQFNKS
jgi:hypothetical protein